MLESTQAALSAVERFIAEPSMTRAVVAGSLLAISGTQWVKKWWLPNNWPDRKHKRTTVLVAFLLGFWPTYALGGGLFLALIVGFANPFLYTIGVKAAYHYFPWLEQKLSARPRKIVQTPNGFEERDITVPSAANEKTVLYRDDTQ